MSRAAGPLLAGLFALTTPSGCGPDPVGVEDCRQIEQARCEAGKKCGIVSDVAACQRFYRDHCLHGFSLDEAPSNRVVTGCVDAIRAAGDCASTNGADSQASDCFPGAAPAESMSVCDAIGTPEQLPACRFLVAEPANTPDASGGSAGAAPDGGEESGTGGASGASGSSNDATIE